MLFSEKAMPIPQDRTYRFNFNMVEVLGRGIINLPEEQYYKLKVAVQEPLDGVQIMVKGFEDYPQGVEIKNVQEYTLSQDDVAKKELLVEISKGGKVLFTQPLKKDAEKTNISLVWTPEQDDLVPLTPPSQEMRDQLVGPYDTWLSLMYSSKDYPDIKSMIVELAPGHYFEDPYMPVDFKEGYDPIRIEMTPDTPTEFMLFNEAEEYGALFIYKIYDAAKPDEPMVTGNDGGYILDYNDYGYNIQGENNYKFRTYQFVPSDSPLLPEGVYAYFSPYPAYRMVYSFE